MHPPATILIVGKRATGKSTHARKLIQELCLDVKDGVIVDPCGGYMTRDAEFFPSPNADLVTQENMHYEYNPNIIKNLIERQEQTQRKSFVLLDNCFYTNDWYKNQYIEDLFTRAAKLHLVLICTLSFPMYVPFVLDKIILLPDNYSPSVRRLYDRFGSATFSSFEQFKETFERNTSSNKCFVIDT